MLAALLTYNLHIIKFIHLKGTIQWFLVQSLAQFNSRTFSSPPKSLDPLADIPHLPSPGPWQWLIYFPSLWICLFWTILDISYKVNHTICYLLWLASFIWHNDFRVHSCCITTSSSFTKFSKVRNNTLSWLLKFSPKEHNMKRNPWLKETILRFKET